MNRTTTSPSVCSRAILRRTRPNAKGIIARQLPKYFIRLHQTEPTGPGVDNLYRDSILSYRRCDWIVWGKANSKKATACPR